MSLFFSATILGVSENALATPIQWETFSEGVTTYESGLVKIKPDPLKLSSESEIFGAGFFTPENGSLQMEISVFISEISLLKFENPRFLVTASSEGFFWNEESPQLTIFDSWSFPLSATLGYLEKINLESQSYLSFVLETKEGAPKSYGLGNFDFVADTPLTATVPVPEPSTMLLFGIGLMGMASSMRRRKK
ncbi:MAG: PEP-CTERM sorting domain-containing protein [Candidatus Moraniibacteriota bacterium]